MRKICDISLDIVLSIHDRDSPPQCISRTAMKAQVVWKTDMILETVKTHTCTQLHMSWNSVFSRHALM